MKLDTDTMNATQRILATINHEEPDRVPTYVMGIPPYSKCYQEYMAQEDEIFDEGGWGDNEDNVLLTPLGDFTMKYYFGADVEMYGIGINNSFHTLYISENGELVDDSSLARNLKENQEINYVSYFGMVNGMKILPNGHEYRWYLDGYLKKKEDAIAWYDKYGWISEKSISKVNIQAYQQFMAEFGDRIYLIPQIGGVQLYESLWPIMGQARFGYYARKDPEYIQRLVDDRKETQLKIVRELLKLKPAIIFGGDDLGQKGRPLMSPAMFRKFFKQPYKEIFDLIHEGGAQVFNHSCGNMTELLPDYMEAGLDGWQSLEPASLIDHAAVKQKYGDKLLMVGGLDSREISFGTPDSIRQHVKDQFQKMGKNGGFIIGPTHDFLTETPLENCLIMRDAIQQEAVYKK